MPKTDVKDDRSLSRLQGIDLREHSNQNVALDCVNLRLNNASRLVPYPRPTKVKSGSFTFACESKNPALQEFDFSLDGFFGLPSIATQVKDSDGEKTKLTGANLRLVEKIVLVSEDGTCIESGQDFGYETDSDGNLILDVYFSSYGNFEKVILINSYGTYTANVDITERLNNVLYFGNTFKVGIDNQTLEFCIWKHSQTSGWQKVAGWKNLSATPWIESADLKVNVDFFAIQDSNHAYAFMPSVSDTNQALELRYSFNADTLNTWADFGAFSADIQNFGYAATGYSPDRSAPFQATEFRYDFGQYASYRLLITENTLKLLSKTDYTSDVYDITLQEWSYEQ